MARTPKTDKIGFINVNKPSGVGSTNVVSRVKWLTGLPCGHMGTLDPLASGVLPVGVGNATRLFDYFLQKTKIYIAEFTFGVTSDTLDSTGELEEKGFVPTAEEIERALPRFKGEMAQIPPRYSAKSVGGKRGYDLARAGVEFELPPKQVRIDGVKLLGGVAEKPNAYRFEIECGGGTYIRSIARDLASDLGTFAVMSALERTKSGFFEIGAAMPFEGIDESNVESLIIPTEAVLPFDTLELYGAGKDKIFNGVSVKTDFADGTYKIYRDGTFYGIAEVREGKARVKTKLC